MVEVKPYPREWTNKKTGEVVTGWILKYKNPITGKWKKPHIEAEDKCEAWKKAGLLEAELKLRKNEPLFFEIAENFFAYSKAHKKSWIRDELSIRHLKEFFGDVPCSEIDIDRIDEYKTKRKTDGVEEATIDRELSCLRSIFIRARRKKRIKERPYFKLYNPHNARKRTLTDEELERLLFALPIHQRPIVLTARYTGMRLSEILNLKWEQVNLKRKLIFVPRPMTKNNQPKVVPISARLLKVYNRMKKESKSEHVFTYRGKKLKVIKEGFKDALKEAEIKDFRFHDLKHCFVTGAKRNKVDEDMIMRITGNESVECFRRYHNPSDIDLLDAIEKATESDGTFMEHLDVFEANGKN